MAKRTGEAPPDPEYRKISSLRDLSRKSPNNNEAKLMMDEISIGSDHTAAIMSTNFVDAMLKNYIVSGLARRFEAEAISPLFEDNGAVPTFSARISIAFAMGLLDKKTRDDLNIIRRVRNAFAHAAIPVKFIYPEISKEIKKLNDWKTIMSIKDTLRLQHKLPNNEQPSNERIAFTAQCNAISLMMMLKESEIYKTKRNMKEPYFVKDLHDKLRAYEKDRT